MAEKVRLNLSSGGADYTAFSEAFGETMNLLKGKKNIVILAGAGMSVSCGLPDFRSKDTGLYSTLDAHGLGLSSPEELFDLEIFQDDPRPFYKFARQLFPNEKIRPSISHKFVASLEEQNMLLRIYTQNIDGLEESAGVSTKRVVYAHGSLRWAHCMKCKRKLNPSDIVDDVMAGRVPTCQKITESDTYKGVNKRRHSEIYGKNESYSGRLRKRKTVNKDSTSIDQSEHLNSSICGGVIKPGVTFFGEKLKDEVSKYLEHDYAKADALIVIGTSLSVTPMSKIIQFFPPTIPRILINKMLVNPPTLSPEILEKMNHVDFRNGYIFDACLLGNCDDVTASIISYILSPNCTKENSTLQGKLLSKLSESQFSSKKLYNQPLDRILLFPGAILEDEDGPMTNDEEHIEVALCDGCGEKIMGTVMNCKECFDYDLCLSCFPALSKQHEGGRHTFIKEEIFEDK